MPSLRIKQHAGVMRGSMPRHDRYQQKAQVHKHKNHTCSFNCPLNPSVNMNSTAHSDFTRQQQKDICGSAIDTVTDSASTIPPLGFSKSNKAAQVYSSPAGKELSHQLKKKLVLFLSAWNLKQKKKAFCVRSREVCDYSVKSEVRDY